MPANLTAKQSAFCREYLVDLNVNAVVDRYEGITSRLDDLEGRINQMK